MVMKPIALCLALSACVAAPVVIDAGCVTYGNQRSTMPPLGLDDRSEWIAETDSAMTGTCRP